MFQVLVSGWLTEGPNQVLVERSVELPFAPFAGLEIDFVGDNSCSAKIEVVRWVVPDGHFHAEVNDELFKTTFPGSVNEAEKLGWTILRTS